MLDSLYKLEFSEEQQMFHMNSDRHAMDSNGYVTILDNCTTEELQLLEAYLAIHPKRKKTVSHILKCIDEIVLFHKALAEENLGLKIIKLS